MVALDGGSPQKLKMSLKNRYLKSGDLRFPFFRLILSFCGDPLSRGLIWWRSRQNLRQKIVRLVPVVIILAKIEFCQNRKKRYSNLAKVGARKYEKS